MKAIIKKYPLDWTGRRVGIEGFNIGDEIEIDFIRHDGLIFVEGTIHGFDKESLKIID